MFPLARKRKKNKVLTLRDAIDLLRIEIDVTQLEMQNSLFEPTVKRSLIAYQLIIDTLEDLHKDQKIDLDNICVMKK